MKLNECIDIDIPESIALGAQKSFVAQISLYPKKSSTSLCFSTGVAYYNVPTIFM
jgi:hypothetical protein